MEAINFFAWDFPLDRMLVAFFAGALLTQAGSLIQSMTQNDLAGPYTLGIDALCVLGILGTHFSILAFPALGVWPLEVSSFLALMAATIFCWPLFARMRLGQVVSKFGNKGHELVSTFLIFGLFFNLLVGSLFSLVQFLFVTKNLEFPSGLWYGNFRFVDQHAFWAMALMSPLLLWAGRRLSPALSFMSYGPDFALSFGIESHKAQARAFLIALVSVALVDSFFGVFGFVGLVFPHLLRRLEFFKYSSAREINYGPFFGGLLLCGLDLLCLNLPFQGAEVPVGLVSGLLATFVMFSLFKSQLKQ